MVIEPCGDLLGRQDVHARAGQLNRQGNAIEIPADVGDHTGVLGGQFKGGQKGTGACDEKLNGVELTHTIHIIRRKSRGRQR